MSDYDKETHFILFVAVHKVLLATAADDAAVLRNVHASKDAESGGPSVATQSGLKG